MTTQHDSGHACQSPAPAPPGSDPTLTQRTLEAGAAVAQSFTPLRRIHAHLCALHAYASQPSRQVIAHHYCTHVTDSIHQCILYDSDRANARVVGIEYLITPQLFDTLEEEEKSLWHSHGYEVQSGMLVMPGLPELLERPMMREIAAMYGKIICTWQTDRDALPIGAPQLMVSLTSDAAVDRRLLEQKDAVTGVSTEERRRQREGNVEVKEHTPHIGDACERGYRIEFVPRVITGQQVEGSETNERKSQVPVVHSFEL